MKNDLRQTILNLATPLIEAQGLVLWGLDITEGAVPKVALYLDSPDPADGGAGIDQCEAVSRQLSLAMDVEDCIDRPWTLEVSSPGLERRFFALAQMKPFIGDLIEVRLREPENGRKNFTGRLLSTDDAAFELEPAAISATGELMDIREPVKLPWANVARARRIHIFTMPQKPGKGSTARKKK